MTKKGRDSSNPPEKEEMEQELGKQGSSGPTLDHGRPEEKIFFFISYIAMSKYLHIYR